MSNCNHCKKNKDQYISYKFKCVKCISNYVICDGCNSTITTHLFNIKNTCKQCLTILNRSENINMILDD